jgi:hypothetical protein
MYDVGIADANLLEVVEEFLGRGSEVAGTLEAEELAGGGLHSSH